MAATEQSLKLHLGIAEQGKILALKGNHKAALQHYREALRLAVSGHSPEVFFRHYTQCVMESLELSGELDSVLRYCDQAEQHYQRLNASLPLVRRDRAENLQRRGCVLLRQQQIGQAMTSLEQAQQLADPDPLPLARELTQWHKRGLTVGSRQLQDAQQRYQYFIVRKTLVDPARAIPLPPERLSGTRAAIPF